MVRSNNACQQPAALQRDEASPLREVRAVNHQNILKLIFKYIQAGRICLTYKTRNEGRVRLPVTYMSRHGGSDEQLHNSRVAMLSRRGDGDRPKTASGVSGGIVI